MDTPTASEVSYDEETYPQGDENYPSGNKIQGIYFRNQRCHRLQHRYTENGANAMITLFNYMFLNNIIEYPGQTRRVTFDQLLDFLHSTGKIKKLIEQNPDQTGYVTQILSTEGLWGLLDTLQSAGNQSSKLRIFSDLGINVIDADDHEQFPPRMNVRTLNSLYRQTNEGEIVVLIRDGFFSTITKSSGIIFEFVTAEQVVDQDPQTTWWTLLNVDGVGRFTNNKFEVRSSEREHLDLGDDAQSQCVSNKMCFIRSIKQRLNERLLSLKEESVGPLKRVLFNFCYISSLSFKDQSYLMWLTEYEDAVLFDGFMRRSGIPHDIRSLLFMHFVDDTLVQLVELLDHQSPEVIYPAMLTIHNVIKFDASRRITLRLVERNEILNKFHNAICIDSGSDIIQTAYSSLWHICGHGMCTEHLIENGLIITLIEKLTVPSTEHMQCLQTLRAITGSADAECIGYCIENGIVDPMCSMLEMGNDQSVEGAVVLAMRILQDILMEKGDSVCADQCAGKSVRKYIEDKGSVHTLHELAISGVGETSVIAADLIFKHFADANVEMKTVHHVLAELGLLQYASQFAEFGIEYSMLEGLDVSIIAALIHDPQDRHVFLQWRSGRMYGECEEDRNVE